MANDLIIGGSTYKNIDYIRVMRSDGTVATYYDSDRLDNRVMRASIQQVIEGGAYSLRAPDMQPVEPEAQNPTAVDGQSYSAEATVYLPEPDAAITAEEGESE